MAQHCFRGTLLIALLFVAGCYQRAPYGGWNSPQPYMPQQPGYMQQPGSLIIPPSNAPLAAPGTPTNSYSDPYDPERKDEFSRDGGSGESPYYGDNEDPVPPPIDRGSGSFDGDF